MTKNTYSVSNPIEMAKSEVLKTIDLAILHTIPNRSIETDGRLAKIVVLPEGDDRDDRDQFQIVSVTQGANGSVTIGRRGTITYKVSSGARIEDSFNFTVSDSEGDIVTKTVTIKKALKSRRM